jgi:molybdopterin-containing oxidoreductase family molybdopterin binding subunit
MGGGVGNLGPALYTPGAIPGSEVYMNQLPEIVKNGKYGEQEYTVKSLYSFCGNPVQNHADSNAILEAFDKIELIIVADTVMNDTAKYADIVLPVCHWFETTTVNTFVTPYARISEKAIDPLYESKCDIDIANLLGQGMGLGDKMNLDVEAFHSIIFQNPIAESMGLSWEALKEKKNIRVAPDGYIFGANYTLTTPTGRAEFYLENPTPNAYYGQEFDRRKVALPRWEPPLEAWPDNPLFKKYPLILMSLRDKFKVHSQFERNPWLMELRKEPTLSINPVDAKERSIKQGDYVKVFNDRGYVVLKVTINAGIRPGIVVTEKGWPRDQYKDGYYQSLTSRKTDSFVSNNSFYDTLCEVEKA